MGQIVGQLLSSKPAFDPSWSSSHEHLSIEGDRPNRFHPPPPRIHTVAFTALLHGDADDYSIFALVLAGQLRQYSANADRVLLLGPSVFRDSLGSRKALSLAGWTHLLGVEAINTPHLDKTGSKRHRYVFTKLRALELPYEHVLLLDLDLLPRNGTDLTPLFNVQAPAGKYHISGYEATPVALEHGKPVPQEARNGCWCTNAGVLRLDPKTTAAARLVDISEILEDLQRGDELEPTYLPEQYYLAQKLHGWHHISYFYNHEVGLEGMPFDSAVRPPGQLWDIPSNSKVWHYSGKCGMQPWMFLDFAEPSEIQEWLVQHYNSLDPGGIVATAFSEWFSSLQDLLNEPHGIATCREVTASFNRLADRSATERRWCDSFRVQNWVQQQAELEPSLKGRRQPWEYRSRDIAFDFAEFAAYERRRLDIEPGPRGDEKALTRAKESWSDSYPVLDMMIEDGCRRDAMYDDQYTGSKDKCSQCEKVESCFQGSGEFASMKYCQSCWQKWRETC